MTMRVPVRETAQGASFLVRVAPRASRTAIVGVIGYGADAAVKIARLSFFRTLIHDAI